MTVASVPPVPPDLLFLAPLDEAPRLVDTEMPDVVVSSSLQVVSQGNSSLVSPNLQATAADCAQFGSVKLTVPVGSPKTPVVVDSSTPQCFPSAESHKAKEVSKEFNWASHLQSSCKIKESSAPVTVSAEGRPRVKVPNAVFERGAKLHSDYIVGIFYGNPPSHGKIWGVLNYLWGRDKRVTIQNLSANVFLFYIPSASLRRRILQHELWRVGDSPFFVTEWKASFCLDPPSLQRAPIWAKIQNIPFDLVTDEGMSFIARPLGVVVDAKPFNSINSAEIKVVADLTKRLPDSMEIEREDGQVVVLSVTYPWLPPLCSVCEEIGHKAAFCPKASSSKKQKDPAQKIPVAGDGKKWVPAQKGSVAGGGKKWEKKVVVDIPVAGLGPKSSVVVLSESDGVLVEDLSTQVQQVFVSSVRSESSEHVEGDIVKELNVDKLVQAEDSLQKADVVFESSGLELKLLKESSKAQSEDGFTLASNTLPARKVWGSNEETAVVLANPFGTLQSEDDPGDMSVSQ